MAEYKFRHFCHANFGSGASTTNNTKILYEFTVTNNGSYDLPAYKVAIKNSSGTVIYDMDSLISGSEVIDIDTDADGHNRHYR